MKKSGAPTEVTKATADPNPDMKKPGSASSPIRELRVGRALFETTWRIATPVVIFAAIGIFLDLHLKTKPWLTLLGAVIGFVFAGLLIARLLKESENE